MIQNTRKQDWLGVDIGGANIKAAHGNGQARILPFEVWKRPEDLGRVVNSLIRSMPACEALAITTTAELCDCFSSKTQGVTEVFRAVETAVAKKFVRVWGIDGQFHTFEEIQKQPLLAAAANWLALATVAARVYPDQPGLLIDIGSTTTDLIPFVNGRVMSRGRTDFERLQCGELVYAGVTRTPVFALASELPVRGVMTGLTAELFATTLDVYLMLGDILPDPANLGTADGRARTKEAACDRLARMVGADRVEFTETDALELAQAAHLALMDRLVANAKRSIIGVIGRPKGIVLSGSGEFLGRRVAEDLIATHGQITSLGEQWGSQTSSAACAYALVELAHERFANASET